MSPWLLRPPSQRSILNSWIVYQSPLLDSSTASHIHPKRTYWPKLSLHVLSAFRFMVLPVVSPLSVKRVSLSSQLPRNHLGSKLLSNTSWFSTTLLCRLRIIILQHDCQVLATWSWVAFISPRTWGFVLTMILAAPADVTG